MKLMIGAASLSSPSFSKLHERARAYFDELVLNPFGRILEESEIVALWDNADAILFGNEKYSADLLARAPKNLKVLAKNGVGYDSVDTAAAKKLGIAVCNTPGSNTESVADAALAYILCLERSLLRHDAAVRGGQWKRFGSHELRGQTLGVLGMGAIGKGVIRRANAFGMKAMAFDLYFDQAFAAENGVQQATVDEIIRSADVLSLHLPSTPETRHIINAESLAKMKPNAIIINTARGELIDEAALAEALISKKIAGAGLDVFENEPLKNSPLTALDNVILTPHIAGNTTESGVRTGEMALQNIIDILEGRPCKNIVNR